MRAELESVDVDDHLTSLLSDYGSRAEPIAVNFRKLMPFLNHGDRVTHYLHPYPAKLLPHIPAYFLRSSLLSTPGNVVVDPFCGSGTVMLESVLSGRTGLGADSNPLARLIASVKISKASPQQIRRALLIVLKAARRTNRAPLPNVPNMHYWFYPHVIEQLSRIRTAIDQLKPGAVRDFFLVCFSVTVRRTSLADPRLSVPVRLSKDQYPEGHPFRSSTNKKLLSLRRQNVIELFQAQVESNIARLVSYQAQRPIAPNAAVISTDARRLTEAIGSNRVLSTASVDLIITSPPYAGAQKYIRASSLSLGWLGMLEEASLRELEDNNIGREHHRKHSLGNNAGTGIDSADRKIAEIADINPLRAHIAYTYIVEMRQALTEAERILRPGGYFVLVVGNNRVCGSDFLTANYLREIMSTLRLECQLELIDDIRSRGLMTRRNSSASVISQERVLLFKKPEITG